MLVCVCVTGRGEGVRDAPLAVSTVVDPNFRVALGTSSVHIELSNIHKALSSRVDTSTSAVTIQHSSMTDYITQNSDFSQQLNIITLNFRDTKIWRFLDGDITKFS